MSFTIILLAIHAVSRTNWHFHPPPPMEYKPQTVLVNNEKTIVYCTVFKLPAQQLWRMSILGYHHIAGKKNFSRCRSKARVRSQARVLQIWIMACSWSGRRIYKNPPMAVVNYYRFHANSLWNPEGTPAPTGSPTPSSSSSFPAPTPGTMLLKYMICSISRSVHLHVNMNRAES